MPEELDNVVRVHDPSGFSFFLGWTTAEKIKSLTFVPVVSLSYDPADDASAYLNEREGGYQRSGDFRRMERIKEFVKNRPNCLIPPVLLCARGKWSFQPSKENMNFGKLIANDLAAIIDGQHRLGGLWHLARDSEASTEAKKKPIPFMVVEDMNADSEMREFVDINDNQKGVKKSLLKYLFREEKFIGQAALALMEDDESPFKGRIDIQRRHDWSLILFGAAVECVELMFSKEFTTSKGYNPEANDETREASIEMVLTYWNKVSESMPQFWSDFEKLPPIQSKKSAAKPGIKKFDYRLLEETGIRAFSKLAADLFSISWLSQLAKPAWEEVSSLLTQLAGREKVKKVLTKPSKDPSILEIDPELQFSGKAGSDVIYRHLKEQLLGILALLQ